MMTDKLKLEAYELIGYLKHLSGTVESQYVYKSMAEAADMIELLLNRIKEMEAK